MADPDDELTDVDLQEEIELVGQVVAAVVDLEGPLDDEEVDRALGVSAEGERGTRELCEQHVPRAKGK